jgi:hypothetical protein
LRPQGVSHFREKRTLDRAAQLVRARTRHLQPPDSWWLRFRRPLAAAEINGSSGLIPKLTFAQLDRLSRGRTGHGGTIAESSDYTRVDGWG